MARYSRRPPWQLIMEMLEWLGLLLVLPFKHTFRKVLSVLVDQTQHLWQSDPQPKTSPRGCSV